MTTPSTPTPTPTCSICGEPDGDFHNIPADGLPPSPFPPHKFTTSPERPAGCRFWTARDLIEWIKANVTTTDPEYAARWWKACLDADSMSDLNGRELAEMCMDGVQPTTLQDVTDELQAPHLDDHTDDPDYTVADYDNNILMSLCDHFDIRTADLRCPRCGGGPGDPSCGKSIHATMPDAPATGTGETE